MQNSKKTLLIICRSWIPRIIEAVQKAMKSQPDTTARYLKRRIRARYLSKAMTVQDQIDTRARKAAVKLYDNPTEQKSSASFHAMARA